MPSGWIFSDGCGWITWIQWLGCETDTIRCSEDTLYNIFWDTFLFKLLHIRLRYSFLQLWYEYVWICFTIKPRITHDFCSVKKFVCDWTWFTLLKTKHTFNVILKHLNTEFHKSFPGAVYLQPCHLLWICKGGFINFSSQMYSSNLVFKVSNLYFNRIWEQNNKNIFGACAAQPKQL